MQKCRGSDDNEKTGVALNSHFGQSVMRGKQRGHETYIHDNNVNEPAVMMTATPTANPGTVNNTFEKYSKPPEARTRYASYHQHTKQLKPVANVRAIATFLKGIGYKMMQEATKSFA